MNIRSLASIDYDALIFSKDEKRATHRKSTSSTPPRKQRAHKLYRRMARNSLMSVVRAACPQAKRLNPELLDVMIQAFLEESSLQEPLYWRIPVVFAEWLRESNSFQHHPALCELLQWECSHPDILNAPNDNFVEDDFAPLTIQSRLALSNSLRLFVHSYQSHKILDDEKVKTEPSTLPHFVLAYRHDDSVHWREVSAPLASLVALTSEGSSIEDAINQLSMSGFGIANNKLIKELHPFYALKVIATR